MIIDAWIQHPSAAFIGHPMFATLRRWMGLKTVPDHVPLAFTLAALDAGGIDRALLSAWTGPDGEMITNDSVAEAVAAHPDRFIGVGSVNLRRPMEAVAQVARCAALGFKGIRLLPWLWGLPPDDRLYYPIYAACVTHGLAFCTQVGHAGPLLPSEPGRPFPYLDRVACDFPELTIIGGHVGYPWTEEMIALARKYPNVWIDTSAYKPSRFPETLVRYLQSRRHKVLFGSNFPMIQPATCLAEVDALGLDPVSRARFLSVNALTAFGLTESQKTEPSG